MGTNAALRTALDELDDAALVLLKLLAADYAKSVLRALERAKAAKTPMSSGEPNENPKDSASAQPAASSVEAPVIPGCATCGNTTVVGYTLGRNIGPFCSYCWHALKVAVREADLFNHEGASAPKVEPEAIAAPPCKLCGGPHQFDVSIPSVVWNAVIRPRLPDYLCASCIIRAFVQEGRSFTAVLSGADVDGVTLEVNIDSQPAQDAEQIQAENNELRIQVRELTARLEVRRAEPGEMEGSKVAAEYPNKADGVALEPSSRAHPSTLSAPAGVPLAALEALAERWMEEGRRAKTSPSYQEGKGECIHDLDALLAAHRPKE